jgi:BMFP domain-containing protein YqiC
MSDNASRPDPSETVSKLFGGMLKEGKSLADEVSDNAKAVARSALGNLDVVSRDEFDAQAAVLRRTRARIEQLESEVTLLLSKLEELENRWWIDRGKQDAPQIHSGNTDKEVECHSRA